MGYLLAVGLIIVSTPNTGAQRIQQCRIERSRAQAATNDRDFAQRVYLDCLNRG